MTKTTFFPTRGVMLDLGRVTERRRYYEELLPWLAAWGYNTVHLHLIDDQRCGLRFPRRPELATIGAFTADELREFIALAAGHGLAVLPEIETLGHAERITTHPRYRHLREKTSHDCGFNAICPAHPDTRAVIGDLLQDLAEIFPHPVIHVGLDEVQFGRCPRCRRRFGANAAAWERFAAHANWVHAEVRRLGRRPAMWADHVVSEPKLLEAFRRDVLMFNWDYNADYSARKAARLLDAGYEVIACPATLRATSRITPNAGNLANLRSCTAFSLQQRDRGQGVTGIVNTVWCPWRYLPGAIDLGLAVAGHLMTARAEDPHVVAEFAAAFYGLRSGARAGVTIQLLYETAPEASLYDRIALGQRNTEPFSREDQRRCAVMVARLQAILAVLRAERPRVRQNRDRYDDVILSAEALLLVARYGSAGRRKSAIPGAPALYRRIEKQWARDRWPGDAMRFGYGHFSAGESLLGTLRKLK
jgi:hypothetical protein